MRGNNIYCIDFWYFKMKPQVLSGKGGLQISALPLLPGSWTTQVFNFSVRWGYYKYLLHQLVRVKLVNTLKAFKTVFNSQDLLNKYFQDLIMISFREEKYNGAVSQLLEILITFENSMKSWRSEIILSSGSREIAVTVLACGSIFMSAHVCMCMGVL